MRGRHDMAPRWWDGRLRKHSFRITVPRQAILDVLSKESKHLSAEDVFFWRCIRGIPRLVLQLFTGL